MIFSILKHHRSRSLLILAFLLPALYQMFLSSANAQPSGYCTYPNSQYTNSWCYSYYAWFSEVHLFRQSGGETSFRRSSGDDGCYVFPGVEGNVRIGNTYTLFLRRYNSYYYNRTRVFIDWNMDGDFLDNDEYIAYLSNYGYYVYMDDYINIDFPCTARLGKTRMRVMTSYYYPWTYDQGRDPCLFGYQYPPDYEYGYGECEDYTLNLMPDIEKTYPNGGDILYADEYYNGTTRMKYGNQVEFKKPSISFGSTQPAGTILHYKIVGPLPSTLTVYEGLDPVTGTSDINVGGISSYTMQNARGSFAYFNDGTFKADRGGEFRVVVNVSGAGCPGDVYQVFTVAWTNDLTAREIVSPRTNASPRFFKYLRGNSIRVIGSFMNTGVTNVTRFEANAVITSPVGGDTLYNQTFTYDTSNAGQFPIPPGQKVEIEFNTFRSNNVGIYKMYLHCNLLNAADQEDYNDHLPRQGDNPYTFEIQHEIQVQANKSIVPAQGDELIAYRTVQPSVEIKNTGVGDASDFPAKLIVRKLPLRNVVYQNTVNVQDVTSGTYNTRTVFFDPMTLTEAGSYQACMIVAHEDDLVREDDTTCVNFTVSGGLQGTYTVGTANMSTPRNFPTIDSAMNALYYRGLAGPVTFELTDAEYTVRSPRGDLPAWDFTSKILNAGFIPATNTYNTITWKPSSYRATSRASVTINLAASTGYGIVFGQSIRPSNEYSIFNKFWNKPSISAKYANSAGYIKFDGGAYKSLKFVLQSGSGLFGSAFYLGKGSSNITIKNVIIENGTPAIATKSWLPMTGFNPANSIFSFQGDTLKTADKDYGYSAGVVIRSLLSTSEEAQSYKLDTLQNSYNTIEGNEISGFGYGVLSLGIGQLYVSSKSNFSRFYNHHNVINKNIIHNVSRAGIYLGYEEQSEITNNRIYTVGYDSSSAASGIWAGGGSNREFKGYNNIKLFISGNEINAVKSGEYSAGIRIEQSRNTFPHPLKTQVHFPDIAEDIKVVNNIVWGVTTSAAAAHRVGIHLLTEREQGNALNPKDKSFSTQNNKIINNTVLIGNDGNLSNTGINACVALQDATSSMLMNNALSFDDPDIDNSAPVAAVVFLQGVMPEAGSIDSDNNAFWIPSNVSAAIYRLIETDSKNNIIDNGSRDDYKNLRQWQVWTNEDKYSVHHNFTADLVLLGSEPNRKLRINMQSPPFGSALDNRGKRIDWITRDIDSTTRGTANRPYDIGAEEFSGATPQVDLEVSNIISPWVYKSSNGFFSDAEYVMTLIPVDVKVLLRNNGVFPATGTDVTIRIFKETPVGVFPSTPVLERTIEVDIPSGEFIESSFELTDDQIPNFVPQTFADLRNDNYIIPEQFKTMKPNVTPRYKIEVTTQSDEINANNTVSKIVRFYIVRSTMNLVVSAENSMLVLDGNSTSDEIAGKLNCDSLLSGFRDIGWINIIDSNRYEYDLFDRIGWEPKSVDYTLFRTMIWSDGDDKALTKYQKKDLQRFIAAGSVWMKRNMILASQEMARSNEPSDSMFVRTVLSASNRSPGNPMGQNVSNNGNELHGIAVGFGMSEDIKSTSFSGDIPPYSALIRVNDDARIAYSYKNHSASSTDTAGGSVKTNNTNNTIYIGTDWRHFGDVSSIIRAVVDYIEANGGEVIPVELVDFVAEPRDKRVELTWTTASELNSDRFEIERSDRTNGLEGSFVKIGEEKAAGKSSEMKHYGPYTDRNVSMNGRYVYRLRMIDKDGSSDLSQEVEVSFGEGIALWMNEVSPNPASGMAKVEYSTTGSEQVELALYDMTGRRIMTLESGKIEAGRRTVSINVSSLMSGTYTLILRSGSETISRPLTVVK